MQVGQAGDVFSIGYRIIKGPGEIGAHQEREVGVLRPFVFVAVPVDAEYTLAIFLDHFSIGIHTEGSDFVLKSFREIDELPLISHIGYLFHDRGRQFNSYPDIHRILLDR